MNFSRRKLICVLVSSVLPGGCHMEESHSLPTARPCGRFLLYLLIHLLFPLISPTNRRSSPKLPVGPLHVYVSCPRLVFFNLRSSASNTLDFRGHNGRLICRVHSNRRNLVCQKVTTDFRKKDVSVFNNYRFHMRLKDKFVVPAISTQLRFSYNICTYV